MDVESLMTWPCQSQGGKWRRWPEQGAKERTEGDNGWHRGRRLRSETTLSSVERSDTKCPDQKLLSGCRHCPSTCLPEPPQPSPTWFLLLWRRGVETNNTNEGLAASHSITSMVLRKVPGFSSNTIRRPKYFESHKTAPHSHALLLPRHLDIEWSLPLSGPQLPHVLSEKNEFGVLNNFWGCKGSWGQILSRIDI